VNAPRDLPAAASAPPLHRIALALLAPAASEPASAPEAAWLAGLARSLPATPIALWQANPPAGDAALSALGVELGLEAIEVVAAAIVAAVEFEPMLARVLAWLQAPVACARPTLGLLDRLGELLGVPETLATLLGGRALASGLLRVDDDATRPMPERALHMPLPLALALRGRSSEWPATRRLEVAPDVPATLQSAAARAAAGLRDGGVLAIRSGHPGDARFGAALVARELGRHAVLFEQDPAPGAGPWLWLQRALPVLAAELAPGETRRLPALAGHRGPVLVATGHEGAFEGGIERDGEPAASWAMRLPTPAERAALWRNHVSDGDADALARAHRHGTLQVAQLARAARRASGAEASSPLAAAQVRQAARDGASGELGSLAQLMRDAVDDEALVAPAELHEALRALEQRCLCRDGLADALGPAARTRYRPGVRALFVGPSGTGKTLAVAWLATRLGLPLYRVDLAAVSSKYIGETEKNLAQLFARAEHAEVVLLFDEADSLFGKRTEVKEANDRFANQQTNYLLQRIETFDGIALLTSNSRARFDSAFTRRLDAIIEFPSPGPQARRDLWLAHLGTHHTLDTAQLNRVAALCDLAGGHIRSATLAAAGSAIGPIADAGLRAAIAAEYRKLGRQVPAGL
jgi:hypothetical protein